VGGARQVLLKDVGVGGIDEGVLVGPAKKVPRMPHEILVQRVVLGDEQRQGLARATACPAGLLPEAGNGARIAHEERGVQVADVDAQFQGRRGCNAQQVATGPQAVLDLAPLLCPVAGAVGSQPAGQGGSLIFQDAPGVKQD
jgi:hypothetical protein